MRNYIKTFMLLVAIGLSVSAMSQGTSLTVFTEKGENFLVYVNGIQKNSVEADHVTVDGLFGPSFKVRVVFQDPGIREINKTIFNSPGRELYYSLRPGKKNEYVMEKTSSDYVHSGAPVNEQPRQAPQQRENTQSQSTKAGTGCDNPMSEGDFQASTIAISNAPFDGIRLTQAKKLVEEHCLYARQISEVMHILSYDSSRLTLAKDAYRHCFDPENYNEVRDALNSNKSREDLDRYIQSAK